MQIFEGEVKSKDDASEFYNVVLVLDNVNSNSINNDKAVLMFVLDMQKAVIIAPPVTLQGKTYKDVKTSTDK